MAVRNTEQYTAWNGPEGQAWAAGAEQDPSEAELIDRLLDAARVGEHDRVLDIGCGAGVSSRAAARRAARGRVLGADLSGPMLERARLDAAGIGNVVFEQADAQAHPFPEGAFDAAISQYGVMFFTDPVAAFTNIGRALRPGGRLVFVVPQPAQECEWYVVPVAALLGIAPRPQAVVAAYPGQAPAMFALSDPVRIRQVLAAFADVSIEALHVPQWFGRTPAEAAEGFLSSGPTRYLLERDAALTREEAHARLSAALAPYAGDGGVVLPGAQWLVTARWTGGAAAR
ncbi:class I SAM-dependent methyltransferase [Nonomuraea terrae]|uniref:class I SAM-dependent methyltransferase n=1 Tax=Nonomuraea terrae TaxID=2530383 RepID=UPI003792BC1E